MWGFRYIEGREEPETENQKTGKIVHEVLEYWFKEKRAPDLNTKYGQIAKVGLKHYPPPHRRMKAEEEIGFEFDGIWYLGFIDLLYAIDENTISINDHKTTVDFKWMKTQEQLREDPQAILYSAWATIAYDIEVVTLQWTYFRTKPPYKSDIATLTWTRDEIWQAMERIHETAKQIVAARSKKVKDLQPDIGSCEKYRGCPHKAICIGQMSATERMRASFRSAKRAYDVKKLKHEPTSTTQHRHLKIIRNQQPKEKEDSNMGLISKLRGDAAKPAATTTSTKPAAARPVLLAKPKTETPKTEAPAASTRKPPLLLRGKANPPPVSEDHEPPEHAEPPVEPAEKPKGTRAKKAKADDGEGINPLLILARFHEAAIRAGAEPDVAQSHYNAWVEIANG